jgi:hypothetical protein
LVAVKVGAQAHMEAIQEGGSSKAGKSSDEEDDDDAEKEEDNGVSGEVSGDVRKMKAGRPPPIEVLDRVKFNHTKETPRSTIKSVLQASNLTELKFSRENLRKVEAKLRRAFVEFYQKLRLLKSYRYVLVYVVELDDQSGFMEFYD